jgi:hypothetical protein
MKTFALKLFVYSALSLWFSPVLPDDTVCHIQKWGPKYQKMWNDVMDPNGKAYTKKYAISIPIKAGLADVLLGYVTAFLMSYFSDRAYLIQKVYSLESECDTRMIEYGFTFRHFNWTVPFDIERSRYLCLLPQQGGGGYGRNVCADKQPFKLRPTDTHMSTSKSRSIMGGEVKQGFCNNGRCEDLRIPQSEDVMFYMGNRGGTYNIFNNTYHNDALREMGLLPETALSCVFHYLFKRKPETCEGECLKVESRLSASSARSDAVTIGIQVRNSDAYKEHFYCAENLRDHYLKQRKEVTFLFVTSDANLQKKMKEKYGDSLVLPNGEPSTITGVHDRRNTGNCTEQAVADRTSILESVRDMHLLSLTDMQIISRDSGFGLFGALMRAKEEPVIYRMNLGSTPVWRDCAAEPKGDSLAVFANAWSGL